MLRRDRDGQWWYEAFPAHQLPGWLPTRCGLGLRRGIRHIAWDDADRAAHRSGVLACLEAIAAGEVYQACVCTQFVGRLDGASVDFFVDAVERTAPARAAYVAGPGGRWRRCPPSVPAALR